MKAEREIYALFFLRERQKRGIVIMYTLKLGGLGPFFRPNRMESTMNNINDLSARLKWNMAWPLITTGCMALMNIAIYFVNVRAGVLLTIFVLLLTVVTVLFYFLR